MSKQMKLSDIEKKFIASEIDALNLRRMELYHKLLHELYKINNSNMDEYFKGQEKQLQCTRYRQKVRMIDDQLRTIRTR
jgi:hypothetical protein